MKWSKNTAKPNKKIISIQSCIISIFNLRSTFLTHQLPHPPFSTPTHLTEIFTILSSLCKVTLPNLSTSTQRLERPTRPVRTPTPNLPPSVHTSCSPSRIIPHREIPDQRYTRVRTLSHSGNDARNVFPGRAFIESIMRCFNCENCARAVDIYIRASAGVHISPLVNFPRKWWILLCACSARCTTFSGPWWAPRARALR